MTDDIRALKAIRRKNEVIWRKNPLCIHFQESCMAVKHAIDVVTVPKLFCYVFIVILLLWLERETDRIWFY